MTKRRKYEDAGGVVPLAWKPGMPEYGHMAVLEVWGSSLSIDHRARTTLTTHAKTYLARRIKDEWHVWDYRHEMGQWEWVPLLADRTVRRSMTIGPSRSCGMPLPVDAWGAA